MKNLIKWMFNKPETEKIDFASIIGNLTQLSDPAQLTFLYRYVRTLSKKNLVTLAKYVKDAQELPTKQAHGTLNITGAEKKQATAGDNRKQSTPDYL